MVVSHVWSGPTKQGQILGHETRLDRLDHDTLQRLGEMCQGLVAVQFRAGA